MASRLVVRARICDYTAASMDALTPQLGIAALLEK